MTPSVGFVPGNFLTVNHVGLVTAESSTVVDENSAQNELENLFYDVGEGSSMYFRDERMGLDARIHDNDSSEQEISDSSVGPAKSRQLPY